MRSKAQDDDLPLVGLNSGPIFTPRALRA